MTATRPCPPPTFFRALLDGSLSAQEETWLSGHLDVCRSCQEVLERLSRTVQEELRLGQGPTTGPPLAQTLERIMFALKGQPFAPGRLTTTVSLGGLGGGITVEPRPPEPVFQGWLGPYEIKEVIGRGGMGVVLKAFDPSLHRLVAIKVLAPHLANSIAARRRFAREGRAAAAVSHEHVVAVHGVDEANGLPYLVMEYVPGISLQERLDRDGPLELRAILRIGIQVASGLAAAHAQGLIHRDIKPANILLENGVERVKITDFGLARAKDDASLTQSGVITGTPQYMAPEQARGEAVDHRADLFSLGSVLYAMCTGQPPFPASSALAVLRRICEDEPEPVAELNPDVPDWLAALIAILLAKDRAWRFSSAADVTRVMSQYLTHLEQPALQRKPPRLVRPGGPSRSRRLGVRALLLSAAGLVLTLGALSAEPISHSLRDWLGIVPAPDAIGGAAHRSRNPDARREQPLVLFRAGLEHPGAVLGAAFAPGGELLATGCADQTVTLWDLTTLRPRATLEGHRERVWSVAFSPNGQVLVSAGGAWDQPLASGELRLWDVTTGKGLRTLLGPAALVFAVAFSPDGKVLAAGCWDQTVRLWGPATGRRTAELKGHTAQVRCVAFSPDGRRLVTGGGTPPAPGEVKLWDLPGLRSGVLDLPRGEREPHLPVSTPKPT